MSLAIKKEISAAIRSIHRLSIKERDVIIEQLNKSLTKITKLIYNHFNEDYIINLRKFKIGEVDTSFGVTYGVKRNQKEITLGDWVFDFPKMIKSYILYFILLKESILHYLAADYEFREAEEAIVNIITAILLVELFAINSYDNSLISSIRARIYPAVIHGRDASYWDGLLHLLFAKKISFEKVLEAIRGVFKNLKEIPSQDDIIKAFSNWVFETTVSEEEVIAPIYLSERLIEIINNLLKFGFVNGTAPNLAKEMNLHENTVRNQMTYLTENHATFWRPELNLEKLNLHNYFLKISISKEANFDKIYKIISEIPYVKTLFQGKYSEKGIIYTPTLICPHIVANNLEAKLIDLQNKKQIEEFTLQEVRGKKHFATITNHPFKLDEKALRELINGQQDELLQNHLFTHSKKEFSAEIEDDVPIDYNLLFFLSILKCRYLLRSRYGLPTNKLPELFERNNISNVDVSKQTDFLNQIEIRARKRGFLTYCFFMRSLTRKGTDVLIIEMKNIDNYSDVILNKTIEKMRKFSFLAQISLFDRYIFTIPGVSHQHYIKDILEEIITAVGIEADFYTVGLSRSRYILFHELYDYEEQKWKM
ncbi:MAG: response regulator transcription factor [Asgard group archaeon]|nr:response regulator transcription factor [Asgard group archaeon]